MVSSFEYVAPDGRRWDLWEPGVPSGPFLLPGGVSGLVAGGDEVVGSLTVAVSPGVGLDLGSTVAEFRGGFVPPGDKSRFGVLRVTSPRLVPVEMRVRLSEVLPHLEVDLDGVDVVESMDVPLVGLDNAWLGDMQVGAGNVTVSNGGELALPVSVRWSGAGGRVTLPSGAGFVLPAVGSPRTLFLDDAESCAVVDDAGEVDHEVMKLIGGVLPELVPVGAERVFVVPAGARVQWRLRFGGPWR